MARKRKDGLVPPDNNEREEIIPPHRHNVAPLNSVANVLREQSRLYRAVRNRRIEADAGTKMTYMLREIRGSIESLTPPIIDGVASICTGWRSYFRLRQHARSGGRNPRRLRRLVGRWRGLLHRRRQRTKPLRRGWGPVASQTPSRSDRHCHLRPAHQSRQHRRHRRRLDRPAAAPLRRLKFSITPADYTGAVTAGCTGAVTADSSNTR